VVVAEHLRENIEAYTFEPAGKVTASFGVAQYDSETIKDLFHRADKALYRAKQNGRNCVETIQSKI
jgi:diguanylate cyclase (GGDEF)-like protein